ncbi:hypothetical protein [Pseudomonas putida]|uniref:hypothetical protein n=1 Tax=Pseudomonas putida TaxID=303 RepID=UPI00380EDBC3
MEDKLLALITAGFALLGAGYFYERSNALCAMIISVTVIGLFYIGVFEGASSLFLKLT